MHKFGNDGNNLHKNADIQIFALLNQVHAWIARDTTCLRGCNIVILNHVSPAGCSQSGQLVVVLRQSGKLFHAVKRCASRGEESGCGARATTANALCARSRSIYSTNPGSVFNLLVVHVKKIFMFGARCLIVIARMYGLYLGVAVEMSLPHSQPSPVRPLL